MAYTVPTGEPSTFRAGDSVFFDVSYGDYPASDGWELTYELRGEEDLSVAWTTHVTADGDGFSVRIPAADTDMAAGPYTLVGRVALAGETHTVYVGRVLVQANPAKALGARSYARQMRDAVRAALLAGAAFSSDKLSISVNGRSVTYRDRSEARTDLAHWEYIVALEDNPDARLEHVAEFARG